MILPVALLAAVSAAGPAAAQMYGKAPRINKEPDLPAGVGIDQKLGAKVPLDLEFHDHDGKPVRLGDCVGNKPTILVLAYYSCPKLCTEVLNGLVRELKALNRIGLSAGRDFNVVTVSINPKDAPTFARMKRLSYLEEYDRRPENEPGWWFLTASRGQGTDVLAAHEKIKVLAGAVGFNYAADNQKQYDDAAAEADPAKSRLLLEKAVRKTKDYVHPSAVMILTPDGTVSQYHPGLAPMDYTAEDVRTSLTAASDGKMGSLATRTALLCFAYDSAEGHYKPVMAVLGLAAAPFPFVIAGIVYFAWRRARREKAAAAAAA
jgi:protein SCO1/2